MSIRNFRIYFLGGLIANTGTWIQRLGQDWLILELSEASPFALGLTTAAQFAPMLALGLFAGAVADRISKRALLAAATGLQLLVSGTLAVLVLSGLAQTWHVVTLAFLFGIGAALEIPTRQAFVSELVTPSALPNAVSLNSASFNIARALGPAVAGLLLGHWFSSTGPLFMLHAASTLATLCSLALLRKSELVDLVPRSQRETRLRTVFTTLRQRPDMQLVLLVAAVTGMFSLNYQMLIALLATQEFGMDATGFGTMSALMAVGSIVGALDAARRSRAGLRLLVISAAAFGLLITANALMPNAFWFGVSLIVLGYASLTVLTTAISLMQLSTTPTIRGRMMGLFVVVMFSGMPLGGLSIGALSELLGVRLTVVLAGVGCTAITLIGASAALLRMGVPFSKLRSHAVPRRRTMQAPLG